MAGIGRSKNDIGTAEDFYPVVPSDNQDLPTETREIIIAVGGDLSVVRLNGTTALLTLPAGRFAFKVARIRQTGTTATGITAVV
jgi:hypothetical protein